MSIDDIPFGVAFVATTVAVLLSMEAGFRMGRNAHRRTEDEKESPVSAMTGAMLGLGAFLLAFTFGIVSERHDTRKELVRNEANAIRTAWFRSDFLPASDRAKSQALLREYLDMRLESVLSRDMTRALEVVASAKQFQQQLWDIAVVNARKDMNSDVAALYIESLNELVSIHSLRVSIGLQVRIPAGIWLGLIGVTLLGMIAVGYQAAIAGSRRTKAQLLLAVSFALTIELIAALDRPSSLLIGVSQQSLIDVRSEMDYPTRARPD